MFAALKAENYLLDDIRRLHSNGVVRSMSKNLHKVCTNHLLSCDAGDTHETEAT